MYKKIFLLLLLFLIPVVSGEVNIIDPVIKKVALGETVLLGSAQPGETVSFVISKTYSNGAWDSVIIDDKTMPLFWNYSIEEFDKSFTVSLMIPSGSDPRVQNVRFLVKNKLVEDTFVVQIIVANNLLKCGISSPNKTIFVGEKTTFSLKCVNDSIAEHTFTIKSNLPNHWFKPVKVTIKGNTAEEYSLEVSPYGYGKYDFAFNLESGLNNTCNKFNANLTVNPTLRGKYFAAISGLPLTVPSIISFYLIDAALSYIS